MNQEGGVPPPDGDRNLGPVLIGVNWAIFTPSWIAVILRSITRIWISRNFGWDDAVMVFAQVSKNLSRRWRPLMCSHVESKLQADNAIVFYSR